MTPKEQRSTIDAYTPLLLSMLGSLRANVSPEDMDELKNDCYFAILKASEKYDAQHRSGATAMTYIARCISNQISQYLKSKCREIEKGPPGGFISMSARVAEESGIILEEQIADDRTEDPCEKESAHKAVSSIRDNRRRDVIERHYFGREKLVDIGRGYGISRQMVFIIKESAIHEMAGNVGRKRTDPDIN